MNRNLIFIFSFLIFQSCSSNTIVRNNSFSESLNRVVASENFINKIPFSDGGIDPRTYVAGKEEHDLYEKIAVENGLKNGIKKADCVERENGDWQICFIFNAEKMMKELPKESVLRKMHLTEMASVIWYADVGFSFYNSALRTMNAEELKKYELDIKLIISGLNKAPGYAGNSVRCDSTSFNDEAQTEEAANRYTVGEIFQTRSFFSTSLGTNEDYVQQWLKPCRVQLNVVHHGGGVLIERLSSRPQEQEVLVKPLVKYKVLKKIKKVKDGELFYEINLEEIKS